MAENLILTKDLIESINPNIKSPAQPSASENILPTQDYFDQLYAHNDDPWDYENRWYEQRKRQICLSLLPLKHYSSILEVGCSNGVFSQDLAARCQKLLCIDGNATAVHLAQNRLRNMPHVDVLQRQIPQQWPHEQFDLIVISEIAYYLTQKQLLELTILATQSLTAQGMLLCCHWRYPIEGFELTGTQVHEVLQQHLSLDHYLTVNDPDFVVDIWTKNPITVAQQEGLV
ncbi:MAG: methyltransferase domain-containing protein [Moraxellaceae bacterium]|nr:MAG: methyltransferase domain-containing protein [Moraxellaceae bacterium]